MIISSLYLYNLLCAIVPCDAQFRSPEIQPGSNGLEIESAGRDARSHNELNRNDLTNRTIVLSSGGAVEGYRMTSVNGKSFHAFEGIPYAIPPVGSYRFQVRKVSNIYAYVPLI